MSNLLHDLSISAVVLTGALSAIALLLTAVEWIVRGSLDPTIGTITALIVGSFVTSLTGKQVTQQISEGKPVLPANGLTNHNAASGGSNHGDTGQGQV